MLVRVGACLIAGAIAVSGTPATALDTAAIAERPGWQKLLHLDQGGLVGERHSAVASESFFLADEGRRNPVAELEATLAAFRKPATGASGEHALCRFPGRAVWLQQETAASWDAQPDCPDWQSWHDAHAGAGPVGLVFISGYMANPASFFGHIMLHVPTTGDGGEDRESPAARELLATSTSFGAEIPDAHGMLTYMANGLTGGYDARFSHAPFYRNTTLYSEHEMRSLWRYPMRLRPDERELLLAHLYELEGHNFAYRFLDENCASRLGRALELAVGVERGRLVPRGGWFVEPGAIVRRAAAIERDGQSLLAPPKRLESRRALTERYFGDLDRAERRAVRAVWPSHDGFGLDRPAFRALDRQSQARVLDTLLSHAAYLKQKTDRDAVAEIERRLLQARLNRPAGSDFSAPPAATPIHAARPAARLQVDALARRAGPWGARVSLRPLKFDLLEGDSERVPNAVLEGAKLSLELDRAGVRLHRFDLVRVTNLNAQAVPLPNTPHVSWSGAAGLAPVRLDCRACRDGYARATFGRAGQRGSQTAFLLAGAELRTTRHQAGFMAGVLELGWLSRWAEGRRSLLRLRHREAFAGAAGRQLVGEVTLRQRLTARLDLHTGLAVQAQPRHGEATLGLARYF